MSNSERRPKGWTRWRKVPAQGSDVDGFYYYIRELRSGTKDSRHIQLKNHAYRLFPDNGPPRETPDSADVLDFIQRLFAARKQLLMRDLRRSGHGVVVQEHLRVDLRQPTGEQKRESVLLFGKTHRATNEAEIDELLRISMLATTQKMEVDGHWKPYRRLISS